MRRVLVFAMAVALTAACGGSKTDDKIANAKKGGASASPKGSPGANVKESTENKLPSGFPSDFPLPKDRRVVYSATTEQASLVYFASDRSAADLEQFMSSELPKAGWRLVLCQRAQSPQPITVIIAGKESSTAYVGIGYSPGSAPQVKDKYSFFVTISKTSSPLPSSSPQPCS